MRWYDYIIAAMICVAILAFGIFTTGCAYRGYVNVNLFGDQESTGSVTSSGEQISPSVGVP